MNHKNLKIIALCSMIFDHTFRIFSLDNVVIPVCNYLDHKGYSDLGWWLIEWFPMLLSYIGRLAAPIFLFCLVQGFIHTRNVKRYIVRIFITAIIAQVPYVLFDFVSCGFTNWWGFNILFTLGLGLLALTVMKYFHQRKQILLSIGSAALALALAWFLPIEGGQGYILIIFAFYLLRDSAMWKKALYFIPIIILSRFRLILLTLEAPSRLLASYISTCLLNIIGNYLGILITLFYSGEKGNIGKRFQYFFYAFYPLHFLVLAIIGYLLML
ncbi:TraX family protein [Clostridiaceae bacterium M8S5]|nr:TraX family protein [Clostridiaceae bacterium M8S5]